MTYLIDTDYVADWLHGRPQALTLLRSLTSANIAISIIGEIYEGIYFGANRPLHERGFRQFLRMVDVLPLNKPIMKQFARIRGNLRRSGSIIGDTDLLIASTAIYHNLTLVTRNFRHYERIPDLMLYRSPYP